MITDEKWSVDIEFFGFENDRHGVNEFFPKGFFFWLCEVESLQCRIAVTGQQVAQRKHGFEMLLFIFGQ